MQIYLPIKHLRSQFKIALCLQACIFHYYCDLCALRVYATKCRSEEECENGGRNLYYVACVFSALARYKQTGTHLQKLCSIAPLRKLDENITLMPVW